MAVEVLVALAAVLAAALAVRWARHHGPLRPRGAPPIFEGAPLVGGLLKFAKGPMLLMDEGYKTKGEVFTVPVLHKRITFLLGPHASPHFFKANDDEMSQKEVYEFNVPTFGPGVVFDVDHKTRAEQFRFFADALKSARLALYVPQFVSEARQYFAAWGDEGVVDLKDALAELTVMTAARTLLGREVREKLFTKVTSLFHDLDAGMLPISVLWPYAPIAAHRKRDAARAELAAVFKTIISARRAAQAAGAPKEEDILQSFIDARYSPAVFGGRALTDEEITGMLIATLFAGQHTSSITSSWTGYEMLAPKHRAAALEPAVSEQAALMASKEFGDALTIDALNAMPALHANITEALRLHPPLIMLLRLAKKPFVATTSKGESFTVPKGDMVFASPAFSHRLPHVFKDADEYQPDRFTAPRDEDKARPFSFIGFGGGRHGCMGTNFAYLQIKAIWAVLLREFELELVDPVPEADYESLVVGPKSGRVRYRRRKLAPEA